MNSHEWLHTNRTYLPVAIRDDLIATFKAETEIDCSVIDLSPAPPMNIGERRYWWLTQDHMVSITIDTGPVEGAGVTGWKTNVQSLPLASILHVEKSVVYYSQGSNDIWIGEDPTFVVHFRPELSRADMLVPPVEVKNAEAVEQYRAFGQALFERLS